MNPVQDSAVSVSRDDAVKFLQTAARNWEHFGPLSRDDFDDVAGALQSFYLARDTTLREQRDELLKALEDILPGKLCGESWGLPDDETVSITLTFGELKAARAAIAKARS